MDNFTYRYPVRQHFGKGCAESAIKEEMARVGRNVLLAYGGGSLKRSGLYDRITGWLHECGKNVVDFGGIMPNPTYVKVQEGARLVRENSIDFILAVGGGSVIDCCKIVSAQAKSDEDIWEMQYTKHRYPTEFVPTGAVVTASGTGAEQNNGAVITNTEKKLKQPLVGSYHSFAILDSDLTRTVPMKQVISGAFDTLSHCMETYMGRPQEDNVSDGINEAVMRNVIRNLRALIADPDDDFARGELMWDSALAENGLLMPGCCKAFTRDELFEVDFSTIQSPNANPFGLVYRGALTENEAGQVNIHRITYSLDGLMAFDASEGMYLYFILAEVIRH